MRTLVGLDALSPPPGGSAVTIGTFDGVHLGHRLLIERTIADAERLGATSVALTWDRHPNVVLRPERTPPLLTSSERKVELLSETDLGLIAVIPFDHELSQWSPERFVEEVLVTGLGVRSIFVGHDWRFGHKAKGDVSLLTEMGERLGFEVHGVDLQEVGEAPVSSSRTRRAVMAGDMDEARVLLGRPFDVDGVVVHGDHRGKQLGFPTANLDIDPALIRPPVGVYAGVAQLAGERFPAAVNIGVNPTFAEEGAPRSVRIEAYILDFDRDLYGETIRIGFWKRLRDELRFDSADELIAQMNRDVAETRSLVDL